MTLSHSGALKVWHLWTAWNKKLNKKKSVSWFELSPDFMKLGLIIEGQVKLLTVEDQSVEDFIRLEEDEKERREREEEAAHKSNKLLQQARSSEEKQNSKWFIRDYREAVALYERAAALGGQEAQDALTRLKAEQETLFRRYGNDRT